MSAPMCPVHKSAMKEGKNGGWYCPRKNGDQWCDQRVSSSKPAATPGSAPGSGGTTPRHLLMIAALDFASRVYQGTGQGEDATELANSVFARWGDL